MTPTRPLIAVLALACGVATAAAARLPATVDGPAGSYGNRGDVVAKAADGDPATAFDAPAADGNVITLTATDATPARFLAYAPRAGAAVLQQRMVGGTFQASPTADFADPTTVATVATVADAPPAGRLTYVPVPPAVAAWRFWRYVSPKGSHGNIAEFELTTDAPPPPPMAARAVAVAPPADDVAPDVIPPPGPRPATFLTGCGRDAAARPLFRAGQVPVVVWFDARPLGDTRTDRRLWDFGDTPDPRPDPKHLLDPDAYPNSTVDADRCADAECPCHVYRAPGTYTVTLTIARPGGATDTYTTSVAVDPDRRKQVYFGPGGDDANAGTTAAAPLASAARFMAAAGQPDTHVRLLPGTPDLALTGCVRMRRNTVVEGFASADGRRPALVTGNVAAFDGYGGQTDGFLLLGVRVTSPTTPKTKNHVDYLMGANGSKAISVRGDNVVMLDCELGYLGFGMRVEDGDGAAMLDCVQQDPLGVAKAAFSQFSGRGRACLRGCRLTGSTDESNVRTDGDGGAGFTVVDNLLLDTHPEVVGKAVLTLRNARRAVVANNAFGGAQVGTSTTNGSKGTVVADVLIRGNLFRHSDLDVNPRGVGESILGNDIDSQPQVTLTASGGTLRDFVILGNTTPAPPWRVKVKGTVPGLVTDAPPATRPAR